MRYAGPTIPPRQRKDRTPMDTHPSSSLADPRLDHLAVLAVRVGLNLAPGQELVMTAPVEAIDLSRRITEQAYRAGASLVTTILSDDQATLVRYRHAPDESFDAAPGWLYDGMAQAFSRGAARLAIVGDDPTLLAGAGPGTGGPAPPA